MPYTDPPPPTDRLRDAFNAIKAQRDDLLEALVRLLSTRPANEGAWFKAAGLPDLDGDFARAAIFRAEGGTR